MTSAEKVVLSLSVSARWSQGRNQVRSICLGYLIKLKTIVAHRCNPTDQKGFEELSDMKTGDSRRP
jgi:hypothetical protein